VGVTFEEAMVEGEKKTRNQKAETGN
jgi:hypothetical protein